MEDRDIYRDLARMIRGEMRSAEAKRLAEREGFQSFSELCGTRLPEELARVRIGTRDLIARLDEHRRRAIDLDELCFWADELYNIAFNHRIAYEPRSEDLIVAALSAISVVANRRLFPNCEKTARALEYIRACLMRRRKFRVRNIFLRIFEDLPSANLANKTAAEDPDREEPLRWADVVLLDRRFDPSKDIYADYNWMIAFTVTTRALYEEERAEAAAEGEDSGEPRLCERCAREAEAGAEAEAEFESEAATTAAEEEAVRLEIPGWTDSGAGAEEAAAGDGEEAARAGSGVRPPALRPAPRENGEEIDRIPALRRLVPNFDFARYDPRYLSDGDGIAEIVLDVPAIGRAEVRYAAKLFCLANRVRRCELDGEPLKTLVVRPGAGRRTFRPNARPGD